MQLITFSKPKGQIFRFNHIVADCYEEEQSLIAKKTY